MIFRNDPRDGSPRARTRAKICGVTHPEDATLAVELGADALGLNFYPGSSRCLQMSRDGGWLRALSGHVSRVGVMVNATHDDIRRLLGEGIVEAVQLHGDEDAAFCQVLRSEGIPFIKAIRVRDESAVLGAEHFGTADLLIDAYHPGAYGGTGLAVDWTLAARFAARHKGTILAGGLRPENVAAAVRAVRPHAVDVASGVEATPSSRPPRKDAGKLRNFFAALRLADAEIVAAQDRTQN